MGLFVDLIELEEPRTNAALEMLCKATHDHDDGIWAPMDSPFIARLVELFTQRGLDRLEAFRSELLAWQSGARNTPGDRLARPAGAMERWSPAEVSLVEIYLQHLPVSEWTLDDHMMAVDFLAQRYLPADDMRTEADWLATRSSLMGRVQASMDGLTAKQADTLLTVLPTSYETAVAVFPMERAQSASIDFAVTRCAENVRNFANDARHRMRFTIAEHVHERGLGLPGSSLETKLLDQFGTLNRDWRRIAVTEAGEAQTMGYVSTLKPGMKVKRVERYRNACSFCAKIDGRVMTVVDPASENKDPETMIWLGKNNVGRSASPRKRIGTVFMEREPHEMWQIPAGLVHPHCRGRWVPTVQDRDGDDADFGDWLRVHLAPAKKAQE